MAESDVWTPERIRKLRGNDTRAAFAARLGVSALTVYRWELPEDAPEARRPRGRVKQRVDDLAAGVSGGPAAKPNGGDGSPALQPCPAPVAPRPDDLPEDELLELLPVLERLLHGDFRRAENALLSLLSSGRLRTAAGRALATQGLARGQLWARADVRGAFTTLLPILADAEAGRLPPLVEAELYVTAALVFGGLDGRILDAGKMNAYAARAERLLPAGAASSRFLLRIAAATTALVSAEAQIARWALPRAGEVDRDLSMPLLRCLAAEARAIACFFGERPAELPRHVAEVLPIATEVSFHYVHARTLAQAALQRAEDAADPDEVLFLVGRAASLAAQARVVPGWHSLLLACGAGEALLRLGRADEAEATLLEGIQIADDIRWSCGSMPLLVARLLVLRGRAGEVRALGARMSAQETAVFRHETRDIAAAVLALADVVEGVDPTAAIDRMDEIARSFETSSGWSSLRRMVALANAALAVFAGDEEQAGRAVRRAERTFDAAPSAWGAAALRWLRGVLASREGRVQEARAMHESALASFAAAKDLVMSALARWTFARVLFYAGDDGAARVLAEADEELARLGVAARPDLPKQRRKPPAAVRAPVDEGVARIAIPLHRLSARGAGPESIRRELLAVLRQIFPQASVRLEEIDPRGGAALLGEIGRRVASAEPETVEIGDGTGRRFRVTLSGRLPADTRPAIAAVAGVASLALEVAALRGHVDRASAPALPLDGEAPEIPGFVCASAAMRRLKADVARLSRSRADILIAGEPGSGKEVVARAIHDLSVRAAGPYVAFNCAAVPRDLFEGALFGYRKGSFTGAASDQPGVIRAAETGTLFLDEVGELPLDVQPKLLRFLENGEIFPLGERRPVNVDVRVIAATFRDLEKLVREGRFREDLFYRLQVVPVRVPPLRDRPEDVIALARFFLQRFTPQGQEPPVLAPDAVAALTSHAWPGNVRELRNVVERLLAFEPVPALITAEQLRFD